MRDHKNGGRELSEQVALCKSELRQEGLTLAFLEGGLGIYAFPLQDG